MTLETQSNTPIIEALNGWVQTNDVALLERLSELELQLENAGWQRLFDPAGNTEFSLAGVKEIARQARLFYLKNPLISRGIDVQSDYTFGRGVPISAKDEDINTLIQQFIDDSKNQVELTSHSAMIQKDRELQIDGNQFLVFFPHENTGRCRVRSIPLEEIDDIITDPNDKKTPLFYKRVYVQRVYSMDSGTYTEKEIIEYYRDWSNENTTVTRIGDNVVVDNALVFHIKDGGFSDWKFGISKAYAALDWARAYKTFLENWATLMQAYARFAMKVKVAGGSRGVAAARTKLNTTLGTANAERNPPASTGATFIEATDQAALDVVKTAGATTKAEEGRRLLLMVAAGQGLPETFYGDVSVGTLATAESLDRPTELKFSNRQEFWQFVWKQIVAFLIRKSALAPNGLLRGIVNITVNEYGENEITFDSEIDARINVEFPEIISIGIQQHIQSILSTFTFDGKTPVIPNSQRTMMQLLLTALGTDDVDEMLDDLFDGVDLEAEQERRDQQESAKLTVVMQQLIERLNNYGSAD